LFADECFNASDVFVLAALHTYCTKPFFFYLFFFVYFSFNVPFSLSMFFLIMYNLKIQMAAKLFYSLANFLSGEISLFIIYYANVNAYVTIV